MKSRTPCLDEFCRGAEERTAFPLSTGAYKLKEVRRRLEGHILHSLAMSVLQRQLALPPR